MLAVSILPVRSHLETSLALIERAGANPSSAIIDVGAGESTFADDLLALGFQNITVLDISETAINACKKRMAAAVDLVRWLVADVTLAKLEHGVYDIWHDRAVFHFLTSLEQRVAYVSNVARLGAGWGSVGESMLPFIGRPGRPKRARSHRNTGSSQHVSINIQAAFA